MFAAGAIAYFFQCSYVAILALFCRNLTLEDLRFSSRQAAEVAVYYHYAAAFAAVVSYSADFLLMYLVLYHQDQ